MGLLVKVFGGLMGGAGISFPMCGRQSSSTGFGMDGGLGSLVLQFQQGGLGHIAQSWIGDGPNQPVTPEQLHAVLGIDQVRSMARQVGMRPSKFLLLLSQRLPDAVHGMTPEGHLSDKA